MDYKLTYRILLKKEIRREYYLSLMKLKENRTNKDNLEIKSSLIWLFGRDAFDINIFGKFLREPTTDLETCMNTVSNTLTLTEETAYKNPATDICLTFKCTEIFMQRVTQENWEKAHRLGKFINFSDLLLADIYISYIENYQYNADLFREKGEGYSLICDIPDETLIKE